MQHHQPDTDVERLRENLGELPEPVARPALIVTSGLPGTGKSYFSRRLRERLPGLLVLESDALRKSLFPSPSYHPRESARLFQACHRLIQELLGRGISMILDATNLSERYRERLYSIADRLGARLIIAQVEAPPGVVRERLKARQYDTRRTDQSDADWQVYRRMERTVQRIQRNHYTVDTSREITPVINKIVRELRR